MTELAPLPENLDELSFKEASAALDETVAQLEDNTLDLEDRMLAFERGIALLRNLRERIASAHQLVDTLMGQLEETDSDETIDTTLQKA